MLLDQLHTVFQAIIKSIQIKFICHRFSTQYNNITIHKFALSLAGQTGDNFALMSAHDN